MRIIDADKLIKSYRKLAAIKWNQTVFPKSWADAYESFIDDIEEQPTIHPQGIDKNRLIEELGKLKDNKLMDIRAYSVMSHTLDLVKDIINQQPTSDGWIPVSSGELPTDNDSEEYYEAVLVTLDDGRVADGCYRTAEEIWMVDAADGEHFSFNATGKVIAWRPYPQPYKESENNV